jgi:crossover junction endodeoxyribonuclease RusA
MLNLELPWPPSINHYWRHTKNGHYISREGEEYRKCVWFYCLKYRDHFSKEQRLSINIEAYPPDKRQRDLDNLLKSLLDALQHARVYPNDSQIDKLSITRNLPLKGKVIINLDNI